MASSSEENCHFCKCPAHAEEFERRKFLIREQVKHNNAKFLSTLLNYSKWCRANDQCNFPSAVLQGSCEMHDMVNCSDLLYTACSNFNVETVHVLLEKGFEVNKRYRDFFGGYEETLLHKCCDIEYGMNLKKVAEILSMLLCYGADSMIKNSVGWTAFDELIIKQDCNLLTLFDPFIIKEDTTLLTAQENLFCYTIDRYTQYIEAETFFNTVEKLDLRLLCELIVTNTVEVIFDDLSSYRKSAMKLLSMKPDRLRFIVEHFDHVVKEILEMSSKCPLLIHSVTSPLSIENCDIIINSRLKEEFVDWLCNLDGRDIVEKILQCVEASSVDNFICFLLSYGMRLNASDLNKLYRKFGNCEFFKILLHMDVVEENSSINDFDVMPRILYDISLDVREMINDGSCSKKDLKELSPYFAVPSESDGPQVPLLIEMSRNVFRRYFIETFDIKNARQFYTLVKLLPISAHHEAVITLEEKLY